MAVRSEDSFQLVSSGTMLRRSDIGHHAADAGENIEGRPMSLLGESARQNPVTIKQATHRVGDRFVEVVAIDEDRVQAGDAAGLRVAGPFHELRQHAENAGGKSASGGRFSGGEADLALSVRESSQRIDEQQHIAALIAEELGDRRSEVSGSQAECRSFIACCDDDNTAAQTVWTERLFEKLAHFTAAFTDEHDDVDVRLATASDLAEQRALADTAAGEETDALTFAASQQGVDRSDAGAERFGDSLPTHRCGRCAVQRTAMWQRGLVAAIEDFAASVEDSTEHLLADANLRSGVSQRNRIASAQSGNVAEREEQSFLIAKADNLGFGEPLWTAMDTTQRTNRYGKISGGDGQAAQPSHSAGQSDGDDFRNSFGEGEHC